MAGPSGLDVGRPTQLSPSKSSKVQPRVAIRLGAPAPAPARAASSTGPHKVKPRVAIHLSAGAAPSNATATTLPNVAVRRRKTKASASAIWERLSQPKKPGRLREALEAGRGADSNQEGDADRSPGRRELPDPQQQDRVQPARPQTKSLLRMKLKRAMRMTLNMTRFTNKVQELQSEIDGARRKADAWLTQTGVPDQTKVGLAVGNWPSRFRASMGRRRRSSISIEVVDSSVDVATDGASFSTSFKSNNKGSRPSTLRRNSSLALRRRSSATQSPGVDAPELLALIDGASNEIDAGDLSPAVSRYLPGVGSKWLRTRGGRAVRLSREGSGNGGKFVASPCDETKDNTGERQSSPLQRALPGWRPSSICPAGHYLAEEH